MEIPFCSFTLKNTGSVQLDYTWSIEPGWTREPTEVLPDRPEEKLPTTPAAVVQAIKSAKGTRDGSRSARMPAAKHVVESRAAAKSSSSPPPNQTRGHQQSELRSGSRMASASDGRPATAMALAYDAGSMFSEAIGSDFMPFSIEPQYGTIQPQSDATFTVRFSPLDIMQYGATLIAE